MSDKKQKKQNITEEQLIAWLADLIWDAYSNNKYINVARKKSK